MNERQKKIVSALAGCTDEELLAELDRRGYFVHAEKRSRGHQAILDGIKALEGYTEDLSSERAGRQ